MSTRNVRTTAVNVLFLVAVLGLAAVAILSGALGTPKPAAEGDAPSVTVIVPREQPNEPHATPPTIPDAKHYPI